MYKLAKQIVLPRCLNATLLDIHIGVHSVLPPVNRAISRKCISTTARLFNSTTLPDHLKDKVNVTHFSAKVSEEPAKIKEYKNIDALKIVFTEFCAVATVSVPTIEKGDAWAVGFIQAVRSSRTVETYGFGRGSKVTHFIPKQETGIYYPLNYSSRIYPWAGYMNSHRIIRHPFPEPEATAVLRTNPCLYTFTNNHDLLYNQATRLEQLVDNLDLHYVLARCGLGGLRKWLPERIPNESLKLIYRNTDFITWLVLQRQSTEEMYVLKTVNWNLNCIIEYNKKAPPGMRTKFVFKSGVQQQPEVLKENIEIPESVLHPPSAIESIEETWRPRYPKPPKVLSGYMRQDDAAFERL